MLVGMDSRRPFPLPPFAAALALILAFSCGSLPSREMPIPGEPGTPSDPARAKSPASVKPADPAAALKVELVRSARSLVGMKKVSVKGASFNSDCSGSMLAIFYLAGYDLRPRFLKAPGSSGVDKLYKMLEAEGLVYDSAYPQPGDLVFWDDTYDKDGDGKADDPLSHVGIVTETNGYGDISYVHYSYVQGVAEERMNLLKPKARAEMRDGKEVPINSIMRMSGWNPKGDSRKLASELYRAFGKSYSLPEAAKWKLPAASPAKP